MKCYYCEKDFEWLTTDHIVPVSLGGANIPKNKVAACFRCNQLKGPLLPSAFIKKIDKILEDTPYGHEYDKLLKIKKNTQMLDRYVKERIINLVR